MNSKPLTSDMDPCESYYQNSLCNVQTINNELLREILQKNLNISNINEVVLGKKSEKDIAND